jgi:hypothetical protein
MEDIQSFFKNIYQNLNKRNIDLVVANMTADVQLANMVCVNTGQNNWPDKFKCYTVKN